MILGRYFLNATSRDVQRCIGDTHAMHAHVMRLFGEVAEPARAALGVLHRLEVSEREGLVTLLVQSGGPQDVARWSASFLDPRAGVDAAVTTDLAPLIVRITEGAEFRFRLLANPTRKIDTKSGPDGVRRNGKRVPVRGDDARIEWIGRRLRDAGCNAVEVRQTPRGLVRGKSSSHALTHDAHVFEGRLVIVNPESATAALRAGVGPGKAYGLGLLSLAPMDAG